MGKARNRELEEAIVQQPDDPDAYRVYGDWLQQQGDERGELVAVQVARLAAPDDPALRQREAELLRAFRVEIFGSAADWVGGPSFTWNCGFIRSARLNLSPEAYQSGEPGFVASALSLLRHPACAFLRELSIERTTFGDEQLDALLHELATTTAGLPLLERVFLGRSAGEDPRGSSRVVALAFPRVRELVLSGRWGIDDLPAASLEGLHFRATRMEVHTAEMLGVLEWPRLETFTVTLTGYANPGQDAVGRLQALLTGKRAPALRRVGIGLPMEPGEIEEVLRSARVLPRLEVLALPPDHLPVGLRLAAGGPPRVEPLDAITLHPTAASHHDADRLVDHITAGEISYDRMYDAWGNEVAGHYSDAKESFYAAMGRADDLGFTALGERLRERLQHIKNVFRSQFS